MEFRFVTSANLSIDKYLFQSSVRNYLRNCSSSFSLSEVTNLKLVKGSTCGMVFPFNYSMSKTTAINIMADYRIQEDVTLGSSLLGLNMNFKCICSVLRRNFVPIRN